MGAAKLTSRPSASVTVIDLYSVPGIHPEEKPTRESKNFLTHAYSVKGMYSAKQTSWIFAYQSRKDPSLPSNITEFEYLCSSGSTRTGEPTSRGARISARNPVKGSSRGILS